MTRSSPKHADLTESRRIVLGDLRGQLSVEQIEQAIEAGRGLSLEQAADLIRDLATQAEAAP